MGSLDKVTSDLKEAKYKIYIDLTEAALGINDAKHGYKNDDRFLKKNILGKLNVLKQRVEEEVKEFNRKNTEAKDIFDGYFTALTEEIANLTKPINFDNKFISNITVSFRDDIGKETVIFGENGKIIGVDMTEEQLEVANIHIEEYTNILEYKKLDVDNIKADDNELALEIEGVKTDTEGVTASDAPAGSSGKSSAGGVSAFTADTDTFSPALASTLENIFQIQIPRRLQANSTPLIDGELFQEVE